MTNHPRDRVEAGFAAVALGDVRLRDRAVDLARSLLDNPSASFPDAMSDEAQLEALYRFVNNESVDLQAMLAGHIAQTHALADAGHGTMRVIHDTTECYFGDEVEGLGFIGKRHGFLLHAALAVSADNRRVPLGVLGMMPIVRPKPQTTRKSTDRPNTAKESNRWQALVERVQKQAVGCAQFIHIMDREGDIYRLMSAMTTAEFRFVIRAYQPRTVVTDEGDALGDVWSQLGSFKQLAEREVMLSARDNTKTPRMARTHPNRDERRAVLSVSSARLRIEQPRKKNHSRGTLQSLELWFVHVVEKGGSEGESVEWLLATSEPASTAQEALAVVDHYRARWRIEEYFKALKTGCSFERRQLGSLDALLAALGLLAPIAWQLLALRSAARETPNAPAATILRPTQLAVLQSMRGLKADASVVDALLCIAALGGHLKRHGPPGWLTLGRGAEKLATYEAGWIAAKREYVIND